MDTGTSRARSRRAARAWGARRTSAGRPSVAATSPRPPPDRSAPPPPRPPCSLSGPGAALGPDHGRDRVEHAVDEGRRVLAAEAPRDLDRLVDGDRGRDLRVREELE